jgi:Flp pilus assembly pilin Flp
MMMQRMHELLTREDGQDLVEYTLLLAFVMFTIIGLTAGFGASIRGIVGVSTSQVAFANTMVS